MYPEEMVLPMQAELTAAGFQDLHYAGQQQAGHAIGQHLGLAGAGIGLDPGRLRGRGRLALVGRGHGHGIEAKRAHATTLIRRSRPWSTIQPRVRGVRSR